MHQDPTVTRVLAWTRGVWEQTEGNIVILSCCDGDCFMEFQLGLVKHQLK